MYCRKCGSTEFTMNIWKHGSYHICDICCSPDYYLTTEETISALIERITELERKLDNLMPLETID